MSILDEIRAAIESSGKSRYRIAKDTGVSNALLSRLMSGERSLSVELLERLAAYFGQEVVLRPKRTRKGR